MKEAFSALVMRFLAMEAENRKWRSDYDGLYASVTNLRKENAGLREGLERARAFTVPPRPREMGTFWEAKNNSGRCKNCDEFLSAHVNDFCPSPTIQPAPARSHSATCRPAAILSQEATSPNPAK